MGVENVAPIRSRREPNFFRGEYFNIGINLHKYLSNRAFLCHACRSLNFHFHRVPGSGSQRTYHYFQLQIACSRLQALDLIEPP